MFKMLKVTQCDGEGQGRCKRCEAKLKEREEE